MQQKSITKILQQGTAGSVVTLCGWVRTRRDAKTFSFIELHDGSCMSGMQIVADNSLPGYDDSISKLTTGSSICVTGSLADSPGKGQKFEVQATSITVHNRAPEEYPLQKKRHTFEYLREIAHLRPRTNSLGAIARLRSSLSYAIHTFFQQRGFICVHTPIITASDCEGAGEMFRVSALDAHNPPRTEGGTVDFGKDFFGKEARLTVSGQLEAECYALALGKVYTFGPTFRAENSNTSRHLAEFWMIEPEMAFYELLQDMDLAEEFVRYLARHALDACREDIDFFNLRIEKTLIRTLENIADNQFVRLTYTEAITELEKHNETFEYKVSWGADLQSEHERFLTEQVHKKPVIVYNYPKAIKAFYMKLNDDEKTVRAMDVLVPRIGELIGGSEREDRHDVLVNRIRALGLDVDDYRWYLDLRKFGGAPHAGFGLGFERLLLLMSGMQNIRDVIPFPRYPGNAEF
ncbi:MAG: asparagine--tRNA ligase [Chitinivibrionales bacterium]|nr:asparagine--tRNA ligase [Chitinivibrionales bacterium]